MGRNSKNPNHPLTRLRKALSTETFEMTREAFAKRYGFSAPSIKAIETGKYNLTPELAARISAVTGVHPQSLLENSDPLIAWDGKEFTIDTSPERHAVSEDELETACFLLRKAISVAQMGGRTDRSVLILSLFQEWIREIVVDTGIERYFKKHLIVALAKEGRRSKLNRRMIDRYLSLSGGHGNWVESIQKLECLIDKEETEVMYYLLGDKGERFKELLKEKERNTDGLRIEKFPDEFPTLRREAVGRYAELYKIREHLGNGFQQAQDEIREMACNRVLKKKLWNY
jgi:plasmid maintenance system antidote protein VapI